MTKDLTTGKPLRLIFDFVIPVWLGMMLQQIYSLVDTAIVGRTLGVLALTNHGNLSDLTVGGKLIGPEIAERIKAKHTPDVGSCILIMATDLPLDSRQLLRVLRRGSVGLARLGSFIGHGSGEVFVGFSTANRFHTRAPEVLRPAVSFAEWKMDLPFRAMAECTEEAVLNSMLTAHTVTGFTGRTVYALPEVWDFKKVP